MNNERLTMNTRGRFIVFYGINNLGKSTQAKLLVEKMNTEGIRAEYIKYAHYDLAPSGPVLNDYLRNGNPHALSAREFQIIQALNKTQYETTLKQKLADGITVVAEDYVGTSIAWGVGAGVDESFLKTINTHLLQEDTAFLFQGERFMESVEERHTHETNNDLTKQVASVHQKLGEEYGWETIDANESIETIHEHIWSSVQKILD